MRQIDARARELMLAYPWPGNVRELSHVIERAVLWSRGADARCGAPRRLPRRRKPPTRRSGRPLPPRLPTATRLPRPEPSVLPPPGMDLERWERTMIEQALRECDGNQTRAAQRLGISRDTLRYRLKKYGIQG